MASCLVRKSLTVDSNSDRLSQDVAICALERWYMAKPVELAVVICDTDALERFGVHFLDVELVGLDHSLNRN